MHWNVFVTCLAIVEPYSLLHRLITKLCVHMYTCTWLRCKVSTWFQWLNVVYAQLEIFCTACNGRHGNLHHMPKVRLCCCFQESVLVGPCNIFIGDVTLALKRLGSLAATLFIQLLVQTKNKENIEALHYWALCEGNQSVTGGFPSHNDQ